MRRARDGKLTAEDFSGVTISLTNPGTIGTVHSVPRLMAGQGAIIGVGATHKLSAVRWGVAEQIIWAWVLTIPASAFVASIAYWISLQIF